MELRFTLSNEIEGSQVINNPDGWQDIKVRLERHPQFHSLVEKIEVPLIFWGSNDIVDGGYHYIKQVETTQGINAIITILIEISQDEGRTFDDFYEGNLELSDIEEYSEGDQFYKLKCPIIQTDVWSKFVNRLETPVDLQSATDLEDNEVEVVDPIELQLANQTIIARYEGEITPGRAILMEPDGDLLEGGYVQIDFGDVVTFDEIDEKFIIPIAAVGDLQTDVAEIYEIQYAGEYNIEIRLELSIFTEGGGGVPGCSGGSYVRNVTSGSTAGREVKVFIQVSSQAPIELSTEDFITDSTVYSYSDLLDLVAGDTIKIFAKAIDISLNGNAVMNLIVWGNSNVIDITTGVFSSNGLSCDLDSVDFETVSFGSAPSGAARPSYLIVTANTIYPTTQSDALLIHDVFRSITERIVCQEASFVSNILGRISQGYLENGCDSAYALLKGLHVRGYSFADKPFFQSFKDAWDGADPIFNLGLGYEDYPEEDDNVILMETSEEVLMETGFAIPMEQE